MGRLGKTGKIVDWVALMDELWTSDDEKPSEQVSKEKISSSRKGLRTHHHHESGSKPDTRHKAQLQVVGDASCLSEDPLSHEVDDCCSSSTRSSSQCPSLCAPQVDSSSPKVRQTDLLSYIDHKYLEKTSTAPLTDMQNLQSTGSTDDGYMTLDNSRLECTPQLSLPDMESNLELQRALFSSKPTIR